MSKAFREAREMSAFVLEDAITMRLRANADDPESSTKTNALKLWADHLNDAIKSRNPTIYSGKAEVGNTLAIHIETTLDLNAPKSIENVYDLTATIVETVPVENLTDTQFKQLVAGLQDEIRAGESDPAMAVDKEVQAIEAAADRIEAAIEHQIAAGMAESEQEQHDRPLENSKARSKVAKPRVRRPAAAGEQTKHEART